MKEELKSYFYLLLMVGIFGLIMFAANVMLTVKILQWMGVIQ